VRCGRRPSLGPHLRESLGAWTRVDAREPLNRKGAL
jgi:hypothetical protein